MRLFAALPLAPVAMERLASLRLRLSVPDDGLRWSSPEQWHITLQFYGEVFLPTAACLRDRLADAALPVAQVHLDSLGLFPSKGILYVSVAVSTSLQELHAKVLRAGETCGVRPEPRPFRPHITLARSKGRAGEGTLRRFGSPDALRFGTSLQWTAQECLLLQSTLRPQGAEYAVQERIGLAQADVCQETLK